MITGRVLKTASNQHLPTRSLHFNSFGMFCYYSQELVYVIRSSNVKFVGTTVTGAVEPTNAISRNGGINTACVV